MARLRTNNVFGTTTNDPLLVAGTTLNSAGLANLGVVAGSDTAVITLDPNRVNGAPEIIIVTAHTGAATSATITRGAEGTAAREHPVGTFWVHSATITDWGTDWADWTPTLTNLTLGNGSVEAIWCRTPNNLIFYRFRFSLGSSSAVGTAPTFTPPVASHSGYDGTQSHVGNVVLTDNTGPDYSGFVSPGAPFDLWTWGTGGVRTTITATVPFTWATSDAIEADGWYRPV